MLISCFIILLESSSAASNLWNETIL